MSVHDDRKKEVVLKHIQNVNKKGHSRLLSGDLSKETRYLPVILTSSSQTSSSSSSPGSISCSSSLSQNERSPLRMLSMFYRVIWQSAAHPLSSIFAIFLVRVPIPVLKSFSVKSSQAAVSLLMVSSRSSVPNK